MSKSRGKYHGFTAEEVLGLGTKALNELTPKEEQAIQKYWDERLKRMHLTGDTGARRDMITYIPQRSLENIRWDGKTQLPEAPEKKEPAYSGLSDTLKDSRIAQRNVIKHLDQELAYVKSKSEKHVIRWRLAED